MERQVTVTIGRTGTKRHPAKVFVLTNSAGEVRGETVICTCGCPNTSSGFKKPNIVAEGTDSVNCRGKL